MKKWVSPGCNGVTDEILIVPKKPRAIVAFMEVKAEDGRLSNDQLREQAELTNANCFVYTVYSFEEAKLIIDELVKLES